MTRAAFIIALTLCAIEYTLAQSGGDYDLSWSVLSGGGVTFSTGGDFALASTVGQPVALGASPLHAGGTFDLTDGFWHVRYSRLSGVVHLLDFVGDPASVLVALQVRPPGSQAPLYTYPLALSASGVYSLMVPLDGVYDLSAKASHWLRQTLMGVPLVGSGVANFSLTNGDVDGDNEVSLLDFGLLLAAFGATPGDPGWNPEADLDGDGEVTLVDFGVLLRAFGSTGDE